MGQFRCRVPRRRTLSARQGVISPLAGCKMKDVIGTARAHFLLALRQPHGYYSHGCRVQRGRTLSARQGVILPLAGRHGHIFCLPCASRMSIIRTAEGEFRFRVPRRRTLSVRQSVILPLAGCNFFDCFAPIVEVLSVRVPCTTRVAVICTARVYFALCRVQGDSNRVTTPVENGRLFLAPLVCAGCLFTGCEAPFARAERCRTPPDLPEQTASHPISRQSAQRSGVRKRLQRLPFSRCIRQTMCPRRADIFLHLALGKGQKNRLPRGQRPSTWYTVTGLSL